MESDSYVESVPKLTTLAAEVIWRFPQTIAEPDDHDVISPITSIPLPASEAILAAFRRNSNRLGNNLSPKDLKLFEDSIKTPLFNLDLECSTVDDKTLARLLSSHYRNLLYVNLNGCSLLTENLNKLCKSIPPLRRLRVLNLGCLVKLFTPWLSKYNSDDDEEDYDVYDDYEDEDDSGDEEEKEGGDPSSSEPWAAFDDRQALSSAEPTGGISDPCVSSSSFVVDDHQMDDSSSSMMRAEQNGTTDHHYRSAAAEPMEMTTMMSGDVTAAFYGDHASEDQEDDDDDEEDDEESPDYGDGFYAFLQRPSAYSIMAARKASSKKKQKKKKRKTESASGGKDGRYILTWSCPNLLALIFHGDPSDSFPDLTANTVAEFFLCLLQRTKYLLYLDLSYWSKMGDLRFLRPQRCVQTLILFDVPDLYQAVQVICSLTSLTHLDISQSNRDTGQYPCPVTTLNLFVTSLPHLASLDITSTNLASNPTKGDFLKAKCNIVESDIVGLRSLRKPLDYLGIFYCDIAAHYHRIPAKLVAGDANETQILLAIKQYMKRPTLVLKVLNEAYQIYRFGTPGRYSDALQHMLDAMANHVEDASIQIAASASIFYIIRNVMMTPATKKRVVNALLTGMEEHMSEQTMVRNCCLSLCQFDVPHDLLFDYTRAAGLFLRVVDEFQDQMTQRIVVYLLNSMACHVEGQQKVAVGELDAVERILNVIKRRHDDDLCDEVMEVSWSFLWNITDETPANCDRFLRNGGMQLFYQCYKKFPDKNELLRNMMGLMGNIAEVKEMRTHLMQSEYVVVFCALLKNLSDGIEISYNSAGVLSHMLSDGRSNWRSIDPSTDEVTDAVIAAVETWQVNARRFINYRSFEPILRLVPLSDCPASQHWSIWALANLSSVDGNKYCPYIIEEGGVPLLERVVVDTRPSARIRELAEMVLGNVRKWVEENEGNNKAT